MTPRCKQRMASIDSVRAGLVHSTALNSGHRWAVASNKPARGPIVLALQKDTTAGNVIRDSAPISNNCSEGSSLSPMLRLTPPMITSR
eukprot:9500342-Pyramimonas_sp.AAC.1